MGDETSRNTPDDQRNSKDSDEITSAEVLFGFCRFLRLTCGAAYIAACYAWLGIAGFFLIPAGCVIIDWSCRWLYHALYYSPMRVPALTVGLLLLVAAWLTLCGHVWLEVRSAMVLSDRAGYEQELEEYPSKSDLYKYMFSAPKPVPPLFTDLKVAGAALLVLLSPIPLALLLRRPEPRPK